MRHGQVAQDEPATASPWHIVEVQELDTATVTLVMGQVGISEDADHLAYREAELDALWSIADMAAQAGVPGAPVAVDLLWEAHDAAGDGEREHALRALERLRRLLGEHGGAIPPTARTT